MKREKDSLKLCTFSELTEKIIALEEDNKNKDKIISELEYRLEKLNIKLNLEVYDYTHPTLGIVRCTRHRIPAIDYIEYQNFNKIED